MTDMVLRQAYYREFGCGSPPGNSGDTILISAGVPWVPALDNGLRDAGGPPGQCAPWLQPAIYSSNSMVSPEFRGIESGSDPRNGSSADPCRPERLAAFISALARLTVLVQYIPLATAPLTEGPQLLTVPLHPAGDAGIMSTHTREALWPR